MALGKKSQAQQIAIAERQEQAINLRRAGLSLREIAKRLNVDASTIHLDLKHMMAEAIKENVDNADQLRALELERLDKLLLNLSPMLQPREGKMPDLKAVNAAIKISEQRAKLLGLYAPTRQDIGLHITWQDETVALIQSGTLSYQAALETFDHDDALVRDLFAKAQVPVSAE